MLFGKEMKLLCNANIAYLILFTCKKQPIFHILFTFYSKKQNPTKFFLQIYLIFFLSKFLSTIMYVHPFGLLHFLYFSIR